MSFPDLNKLKVVFQKYPDIRAGYLFGSLASGNDHHESDLDFAIYTSSNTLKERLLDIYEDLAGIGFCKVDLIFLNNVDIVTQYEAVRQNYIVYKLKVSALELLTLIEIK